MDTIAMSTVESEIQTVPDLLKKIKKVTVTAEDSEESRNLHASFLQDTIGFFQKEIVMYFHTRKNVKIQKSFEDLIDIVFRLKMVATAFTVHEREHTYKTLTDENYITDTIIDIYRNDHINRELNMSVINTLEMTRDKKFFHHLFSLPAKELNEQVKNVTKLTYSLIEDYIHVKDRRTLKNYKDIIYNSLALEYVGIVYMLHEESVIKLTPTKLEQLKNFSENARKKYSSKVDIFVRDFYVVPAIIEQIKGEIPRYNLTLKVNKISTQLQEAFQNSVKEIIELIELEKNWDDDDAQPISINSITDAIQVAFNVFYEFKTFPSFVAPTAYSGVLLEYNSPNGRLDIRFGDEEKPIVNYFEDGKLILSKQEFSIDLLNSVWKKNQTT